jgi:polysaccharide biosynthesis protein PslH
MKILQLCNKVPYPAIDGGAIATLNLSKGLVMSGHELTVLAMNTKKHRVDPKSIPADLSDKIQFELVEVDAPISGSGALSNLLFSRKPYTASRFYSSVFKEKLIQLLTENQYEIVQLEGLYLSMYIPDIRANSKARIAYRAHNIEYEIWERVSKQETSRVKRLYLQSLVRRIKIMEKMLMNQYDLLVPITERDAHELQILGNRKPVHVCQTGVFTDEYNAGPKGSPLSLIHIGALDWAPNQEGISWFLEKVWPDIMKEMPEITLHIAGRNAPARMEQLFEQTPGLHYHGEVENAHSFMTKGQVMIVPLRSGSGMRIKIIEAMALGRCVVTSKIGTEGIQSTHEDNILISDTPNDFKNNLLRVLQEPDLSSKIGQKARIFVESSFDNKLIADRLADFFKMNMETGDAE